MKQQNKTAIYLRGFYRLFDFTCDSIFNTFESIYGVDHIDWYVLFWETQTTDIKKIQNKFIGKNLIYCQLINDSQYPIPKSIETESTVPWRSYKPCYWRLAYLDQLLNTKKCLAELQNNIVYDTVIFARTDVIYQCSNIDLESELLDTFYINTQDNRFYNDPYYDISICDLYYKTNSITADIIASRFLDTFTPNLLSHSAHTTLASYINRNQLIINSNSQMLPILVRPDTLDVIGRTEFDLTVEEPRWTEWVFKPTDYKRNCCTSLNIDLVEYSLT